MRVEFSADDSVVLTEGSRAVIRYDDLIGNRFLALMEGAGGDKTLRPGDTIPVDRTEPALDLDALIGGFRPLFRALNPNQVNELTGQLIQAFQGQGPTIGSFLNQAAAVTNTLADRDLLIGQVIDNLNVVLGSLGGQSERFDKAVTSLSELVHGLAERRTDLSHAVAYINAGAGSFADLFSEAREPFQKVVHELDRAAGIGVADHEYLDRFLDQLPDKYRELNRQGDVRRLLQLLPVRFGAQAQRQGWPAGVRESCWSEHGAVCAEMKIVLGAQPPDHRPHRRTAVRRDRAGRAELPEAAVFQPGQELLGLLRRRRGSVHRRRRGSLRVSRGKGVQH